MMNTEFVKAVEKQLALHHAQLVAVTKNQPDDAVQALYDNGLRIFGENRVKEVLAKQARFPKDISWHLIGHLQRNKVKYIAPFIACIHSVDSVALLEEINKQAEKNNRCIDVLLQVYIATEETKFGFSNEELLQVLSTLNDSSYKHVRICGLMGMASQTEDRQQIKNEFAGLQNLFEHCKKTYFSEHTYFKELSMGMSSDYDIALACGSTIVRIGSRLFR